jgi:hypothetical protein
MRLDAVMKQENEPSVRPEAEPVAELSAGQWYVPAGMSNEDIKSLYLKKAKRSRSLPIKSLNTDKGLQNRSHAAMAIGEREHAGKDSREHVLALRSDFRKEGQFREPLWVAEIEGCRYVISGHHRLLAYKAEKQTKAKAVVLKFQRWDEMLKVAMSMNQDHETSLKLRPSQRVELMWQEVLDITDDGKLIKTVAHGKQERLALPNGMTQERFAQGYQFHDNSNVSRQLKLARQWTGLTAKARERLIGNLRHNENTGKPIYRDLAEHLKPDTEPSNWTPDNEKLMQKAMKALSAPLKESAEYLGTGESGQSSTAEAMLRAYLKLAEDWGSITEWKQALEVAMNETGSDWEAAANREQERSTQGDSVYVLDEGGDFEF